MSALEPASRETCPACLRPVAGCVCARVPRVDNRTPVFILQHPRERFHPFGSVRLARIGLARCELDVFGPHFEHLRTWSRAIPAGAALLYPSRDARPLDTLPPAECPTSLVVIDGTWSQAKNVLRDSPELQSLPRVMVTPPEPGLYRVRREPALHCMSTLEAIIEALRVLEPDTQGLDALKSAFTGLIDAHLELRKQHPYDPFRRARRPRPKHGLPAPLAPGLPGLVVVNVEVLRHAAGVELVSLGAVRPATGETLALCVRPERLRPDAFQLGRMELTAEQLDTAPTLAQVQRLWRSFLRPGDAVSAWSLSTLDALRDQLDPELPSPLHLKGAYCNLRKATCGELTEMVGELGLALEPLAVPGRTGHRLACALAVARAMSEGRIPAAEARSRI